MTLHIRSWIPRAVNKIFSSLHARTFSHATEDLEKVRVAVINVVGPAEVTTRRAEGHHGNPIDVLEATLEDESAIAAFFSRFSPRDLEVLRSTLGLRVDDGCNMFVKVDKQSAYKESLKLGTGDDVISIRVKIQAFPAKSELAQRMVGQFLDRLAQDSA